MIGLVGHWEIAASLDSKKMMGMWNHTAKSFGADTVLMIVKPGDDQPSHCDEEMGFSIYESLDDLRAAYPKVKLVFIDHRGDNSLLEFKHPKNVLYVFGSDYGSGAIFSKGDTSVYIPCDNPYIYAHVAAGIVLADRWSKWHSQ